MNWFLLLGVFHALYISVVELKIDDGEKAKVTIKVFEDDIADAVRAEFRLSNIPRDGTYSPKDLKQIDAYFKNHIFLISQSDTIKFNLIGHSSEDQSVWIEMESDKPILSIEECYADFLIELFPAQVNMLHLELNGKKRFSQLNKKKSYITIEN